MCRVNLKSQNGSCEPTIKVLPTFYFCCKLWGHSHYLDCFTHTHTHNRCSLTWCLATRSRILKRKWLIINTFAFLSAVSSTQKYLVTFNFKKSALYYMYTYLPLNHAILQEEVYSVFFLMLLSKYENILIFFLMHLLCM